MIKLIIFDWDDVFTIGAKVGYFTCYHKAINGVGVHLTKEEEKKRILAKWSKPYREELKELLKEHLELVDDACKIFEKEYWGNTFVDSLKLLPGTNELLLRLQKKHILAIATGNHPKMLKKIVMPHFKIPQVFSQIVSSHEINDVQKMKPHPYMLELILKKQKVSPSHAVFVGDAKTDVLMAHSAKVTPVVVLTGHLSKEDAQELGVKHIIEDATLIEDIIQKI